MKKAICLGMLLVLAARAVRGGDPLASELNWQFRYDEEGRLATLIGPGDREIRFEYARDPGDRYDLITRTSGEGAPTRYVYEGIQRVAMRDAGGDTRYAYDARGRLAAVLRQGVAAVNYTYDTLDRPTSISVGEDATVRYVYDFLGRLERLETPAGAITYEYQTGQSMMIRTLPNGLRTIWRYHPDGSLQELTHVNRDSQILLRFRYTYCPGQLITEVTEWSPRGERVLTYEYDQVHRLTAVADSQGGRTEYRYDKPGNRTARLVDGRTSDTSEYDWAGRLVRHNGRECTHDAAGNLAAYQNRGSRRKLAFDALDRVQSVQSESGTVRYDYDGDGNLVRRSVGGKTTRFVPDPRADIWRPLLATGPDGEQTFYVWEGDTPLAEFRGTEVTFFLHDDLGSVRLTSDGDGQIVKQSSYRPFGSPDGESDAEDLTPGFTGLFYDAQAGLYLTRARGYDPQLGRFLQRDPQLRIPFGSQKDTVAYVYCGNDPLNYVDRDGLAPVWGGDSDPVRDFKRQRAFGHDISPIMREWRSPHEIATEAVFWLQARKLAELATGASNSVGLILAAAPVFLDLYRISQGGERAFETARKWIPFTVAAAEVMAGPLHQEYLFHSWNTPHGRYTYTEWHKIDKHSRRFGYEPGDIRGWHQTYELHTPRIETWGEPRHKHPQRLPSLPDYHDKHIVPLDNRHFLPPVDGLPDANQYGFAGGGSLALEPSSVGGVYLRGAGGALAGLGPLRGIALDEATGRLVLLAEDSSDVALPPLRIDDLVTVFRSVYLYGEGPSVTIDPNPEDPKKYAMIVVHGKGTENTYVGWVLYEADRLMKGYGQGVDNISREEIESRIPGYAEMLETVYFGGEVPLKNQEQGNWERFWIVPDAVNRIDGPRRELTLFDVPLKVRTQKMTWDNGRLVDDPSGRSSPGALAFTSWFTRRYDDIAAEQDLTYLTPPPEAGITHPVPVFAELRRVALMTAIAEKLRDQGVPMPQWMWDHPVRELPVDRFTPGVEVTRERAVEGGTRVSRIFGGVNLSPPSESVRNFRRASDAGRAPVAERAEVGQYLALAQHLEPAVTDWLNADVLNSVGSGQITHDGQTYQAACLPGGETRSLGACRLAEIDLAVPLHQEARLELTRNFHSFFLPSGEFGDGWTLNLPRLVERRRPVERTVTQARYRREFLLSNPLGSLHALFDRERRVPELNARVLVSEDDESILGLTGSRDERLGFDTRVVYFRDGRAWHFDQQGHMAAQIQAPFALLYQHNAAGQLQSIRGYFGQDLRAEIQLDYDAQGRIVSAHGSDDTQVVYTYDAENQLLSVSAPDGESRYEYAEGLVAEVTRDDRTSRRFHYDSQGRLVGERTADGEELAYQLATESDGTIALRSVANQNSERSDTVRYDATLRPLSHQMADGSHLQWQYDAHETTETLITPDGDSFQSRRSTDGSRAEWVWPDGTSYKAERDAAGRPLTLTRGGDTVARYQWRPDGQLAEAACETSVVRPSYRADGVLNEIFLSPREEKGPNYQRWMLTDYNQQGSPTRLTDFTGLDVRVDYDANGEPTSLTKRQGDALHRVQFHRDEQGRLVQGDTSWGELQRNHYDPKTGDLQRIEFERGEQRAEIQYEQDRVVAARQFDGGQYRVTYHDGDAAEQLPRRVTAPNGLVIDYAYDSEQRLTTVTCGDTYRLNFNYDEQGRLTRLGISPPALTSAESPRRKDG